MPSSIDPPPSGPPPIKQRRSQRTYDALVETARHDPRAFEALYLRHRTSVYRYLRARVGNDDDAADLTATTFERAFAAWYKEPGA